MVFFCITLPCLQDLSSGPNSYRVQKYVFLTTNRILQMVNFDGQFYLTNGMFSVKNIRQIGVQQILNLAKS